MDTMDFHCGHEDEWEYFEKAYPRAIEALTAAHEACFQFLSLPSPDTQEGKVVLYIAAGCLKEFEEICLLAGNGYGGGATKLLRSLYERAVTLSYLALKPEKVAQFIAYSAVHWHKLLTEAERVDSNIQLSQEEKERIRANFEQTRDQFMQPLCSSCGTERLQMSWTKKPLPDQAGEVDPALRSLCFNAYLRPTFYLHTTMVGTVWQMDHTDAGEIIPHATAVERDDARRSLELAHLLMIRVAMVLNEYFHLGLTDQVDLIAREWTDSWKA